MSEELKSQRRAAVLLECALREIADMDDRPRFLAAKWAEAQCIIGAVLRHPEVEPIMHPPRNPSVSPKEE